MFSTAANSYATAKAQVAQAEAALASAREQLAWCTVTSPSAGVVGSLPFKVGALVSASGQALTTVSNISTMEVFFSLSESQILNMSKTNHPDWSRCPIWNLRRLHDCTGSGIRT